MSGIVDRASERFRSRFGFDPEVVVRAPGRVNLIGEHTDYNEGFVFPVAIDRWVVFAARPRSDSLAVVVSAAHDQEARFAVDRPVDSTGLWEDYPRGVLSEFQKAGHGITGFEAVLVGDVPVGAGLSSSAAVEMAVGKDWGLPPPIWNSHPTSHPVVAFMLWRPSKTGVVTPLLRTWVFGQPLGEGHSLPRFIFWTLRGTCMGSR